MDECGEADDADEEEEREDAKLAIRLGERVAERLQAGRVARELQHAEDAQHTQDLQDAPHLRDLIHRYGLRRRGPLSHLLLRAQEAKSVRFGATRWRYG